MSKIDWELKFKNLLSKYMNGVDLAFQKGYIKGKDDASKEQMQQQQADLEQQAAAAQGMGGAMPGDPAAVDPTALNAQQQEQAADAGQEPGGTELDQHLQEMESLVAKSKGKLGEELKKTLASMKKETEALNKSLYKKDKLLQTKNAVKNVTGNAAPSVLTEQHKVVKSMIANWDDSSLDASNEIEKVIKANEKQDN